MKSANSTAWDERARRQDELRKQEVHARYRRSAGIPDRHLLLVETALKTAHAGQVKAYDAARKIAFERTGICALIGGRGVGKTQIGVILCCEAIRHLKRARYVRCAEMFVRLRECYQKGAEVRERDVMTEFTDPWLLVVDEAHERGNTEAENRFLTILLDKRYGDLKPTLLIANNTPEEFRAQIGESIYDRLHETGGWIDCQWPSYRASTP